MRRNLLALVVSSGLAALGFAAEKEPAGKGLAVATVGQPDRTLSEQVASHLRDTFGVSVRVEPHRPAVRASVKEEGVALAKELSSKDLGLLALINIPAEVKFRQVALATQRVAMLNVWALRAGDMTKEKDRAAHSWRVRTEAVHAVGLLLGLEVCLYPRCAMHVPASKGEEKLRGCNLCPPCSTRCRKMLRTRGAEMLFE